MVKYYVYCECQGDMHPDAQVFKVKVGSSRRDRVKCSLLENYAEDMGYFFRPYDEITTNWLILRNERLFKGSEQVGLLYGSVLISVRDLYRHIIDGDLHTVKPSSNYIHNLFLTKICLYPAVNLRKKFGTIIDSATTFPRKNLSPRHEDQVSNAMVSFGLITLLFIIGAILEGIEKSVLW